MAGIVVRIETAEVAGGHLLRNCDVAEGILRAETVGVDFGVLLLFHGAFSFSGFFALSFYTANCTQSTAFPRRLTAKYDKNSDIFQL